MSKLHQRAVGEGPVGVKLAALERGLEDIEGRDLRFFVKEGREKEDEVGV